MTEILEKVRRNFKKGGVGGVFSALATWVDSRMPKSSKQIWRHAISDEVSYWDNYFRTKGGEWQEDYSRRFDPDLPLQERAAELLPDRAEIAILDVGAGPLTFLGKKCAAKTIHITPVDPLAPHYDTVMKKHGVVPLVRTQEAEAEHLTKQFPQGRFDFVFARNCLDHAYDPVRGISEMIAVVKPGCHVLLEHRLNEADRQANHGLHQWNFFANAAGDFVIGGKSGETNVTRKFADLCTVTCETHEGDNWILTRIKKK